MKLFLIGTLLFSGSGVAAMQNENVNETVSNMYHNVRQRVQKRVKENSFESLRENGFQYPSHERLDQQFAIISAIDQVNARYDWATMSDDEIKESLELVQADMKVLTEELGIKLSETFIKNRFNSRVTTRTNFIVKEHLIENLKENGIEYPTNERLTSLTEEQSVALITKIDEINAKYDWATMSDDEIIAAMADIKLELQEFNDEFDIAPIQNQTRQGNRNHGNRSNRYEEPNETEAPIEGTDET